LTAALAATAAPQKSAPDEVLKIKEAKKTLQKMSAARQKLIKQKKDSYGPLYRPSEAEAQSDFLKFLDSLGLADKYSLNCPNSGKGYYQCIITPDWEYSLANFSALRIGGNYRITLSADSSEFICTAASPAGEVFPCEGLFRSGKVPKKTTIEIPEKNAKPDRTPTLTMDDLKNALYQDKNGKWAVRETEALKAKVNDALKATIRDQDPLISFSLQRTAAGFDS